MSESEAHQGFTQWQCRRCNEEVPHFTTILTEGNKRVIVRTCVKCRAETAEMQERDETVPHPGESPAAWVQRITPSLRRDFRNQSDPAEQQRLAKLLAKVLDMPVQAAWRFLMSDEMPPASGEEENP